MESSLQSLIVSASLGALIGLIRQWGEQKDSEGAGDHFAGIRTFVLWSLIGYTAAYIDDRYSPFTFVVAMALVITHLLVYGFVNRSHDTSGLTTAASAIVTLLVGGLVYWDHLDRAVILAGLTIVVLGIKQMSHSWTKRFTEEDIRSTLQFVAVTGVILPLVPNKGFGPYEAINPYSIWFMVVLISGLGFVGYLLIRLVGTRAGVALAGLVGGLASSTATTLAFSRESKTYPNLSKGFSLAIVMACTVMLARVLVILGLILPSFVQSLWLPFLVMAVPGVAYTVFVALLRKGGSEPTELPDIKNPLGLSIAIKFALIYGIIAFLVEVLNQSGLTDGLLLLSFISGLTDLDAIALSITNSLKGSGIGLEIATRAIIVAAIANTILKAGLVMAIGSPELRKHVGIALGSTVLAGIAAAFLV